MTLHPAAARAMVLAQELRRRAEADRLSRVRWLPGQYAWLSSPSKRKLFRAGNQAQGKTWAGAAELLWRMAGRHPLRAVREGPIRAWVVCGGGEQSQTVQQKVWELVPREWVAEGCFFDDRKGAFTGKYPKIRLKNGSTAWFKSGGQDGLNLASGTLDYIWIDEPPESERVYNELLKRLIARNGDLGLTLTPVNRPVAWLRELVERGGIDDFHFRLEPRHLIPVGAHRPLQLTDGTVCDQSWIDALIAETSPAEVPVVIHGEWEFRTEGGYLATAWDPTKMIRPTPPSTAVETLIGIDIGDRPGKQIVLLVLVDEHHPSGHPYVYVWDEYVAVTGRETPEDDARGILGMLRRNNTSWSDLKYALSDRAHKAGTGEQKSAKDLQAQVAKILGIPYRLLKPAVWVAKEGEGRGAGSVLTRSRWLFHQMVRGNIAVHPRCKRLIEAIPKYSPFSDDDWKDPIDALVYGLDRYIYSRIRTGPKPAIHFG